MHQLCAHKGNAIHLTESAALTWPQLELTVEHSARLPSALVPVLQRLIRQKNILKMNILC